MAISYYHEFYTDFIEKYNIRNGELASQAKLNESVNVLKKEVQDLYNRSEIIRGNNCQDWKAYVYYKLGELVHYQGKNYVQKTSGEVVNEPPFVGSAYWEEVHRADYTMELDPYGYLHINNTIPYNPTDEYNPATKRYVDEEVSFIYQGLDKVNGVNFLELDRVEEYNPTGAFHPSTKKYVDDSIQDLASGGSITVGNTLDSNALGKRDASKYITLERKFSGNYNGMAVKNGPNEEDIIATDWIRTTANGLLPYDMNTGSNLGSPLWKFKEVHANEFHGNVIAPSADVAEAYESDLDYEEGTVLGIGTDTEVTKFKKGMKLAGVCSQYPAYSLNSEINADVSVLIALKGRVPVKIVGSANRGDYINALDNGMGKASLTKTPNTIGICITSGTGEVEVKI